MVRVRIRIKMKTSSKLKIATSKIISEVLKTLYKLTTFLQNFPNTGTGMLVSKFVDLVSFGEKVSKFGFGKSR